MRRPGWEIAYSPAWDGYLVKIHGETVLDADGIPSVYRPPREINNERDYDRWREQVCESIERMSGVPCKIGD